MESEIQILEGFVTRKLVAVSSKSEHWAPVLCTGDTRLVLQRPGRAFDDPELLSLVGRRVRVRGCVLGGHVMQPDSWEAL